MSNHVEQDIDNAGVEDEQFFAFMTELLRDPEVTLSVARSLEDQGLVAEQVSLLFDLLKKQQSTIRDQRIALDLLISRVKRVETDLANMRLGL